MKSPGPRQLRALASEVIAQSQRLLIVLAGINGAGKSSLYDEYIDSPGGLIPASRDKLPFVNADLIARRLPATGDARADALHAASVAEQERQRLLASGASFCMETVFSDRSGSKLGFMAAARNRGYTVILLFVGLAAPDLAILRVAQRVRTGGHHVPPETVRERYPRTLINLARALPSVDLALIYDNSDADVPYRVLAAWRSGHQVLRTGDLPQWYRDVLVMKQSNEPPPARTP